MSTTAHCVSGYGQGTDTSAVLTNRSKYITIIADEPYFSRHSRTFPLARQRKGTRPMHKTTLTYEVKPVQTTYVSCMKAVGKHFFLTVWGNRCALFKFHPVCEAPRQTTEVFVIKLIRWKAYYFHILELTLAFITFTLPETSALVKIGVLKFSKGSPEPKLYTVACNLTCLVRDQQIGLLTSYHKALWLGIHGEIDLIEKNASKSKLSIHNTQDSLWNQNEKAPNIRIFSCDKSNTFDRIRVFSTPL